MPYALAPRQGPVAPGEFVVWFRGYLRGPHRDPYAARGEAFTLMAQHPREREIYTLAVTPGGLVHIGQDGFFTPRPFNLERIPA